MILSRLTFGVAAILLAATAQAGPPKFSPLDGRVVERTALVPASTSIEAYTAPQDKAMLLTRFCASHCLECKGATVGTGAFSTGPTGCVEHQPGVRLPPGEVVSCRNSCRIMDAALFSGVSP